MPTSPIYNDEDSPFLAEQRLVASGEARERSGGLPMQVPFIPQPDRLRAAVDELLATARRVPAAAPLAIIAAHAAYIYSGAAAAAAFAAPTPHGRHGQVVMVGPAHYHPFRHGLPTVDASKTSLEIVPVARDARCIG
jgi:AmmeMemoRadiSam system protein B